MSHTVNGWTARPIPAGTVVERTATTPRAVAGHGFWGIYSPTGQIEGFAEREMACRLVDRVYSRR